MEAGKCPDFSLKISSDFTLTNVGTVLEQWSVAWQTSCLAASRKLRGLIITKPLNFQPQNCSSQWLPESANDLLTIVKTISHNL